MPVESLSQVLRPALIPIESVGSWAAIEDAVGVELPDDFKVFIRVYGSGIIGTFITIFNPFDRRPALNFLEQSRQHLSALSVLFDHGEEKVFDLFPSNGGLLPVGRTENGDVIHWLTRENSADWTMVVNEARSPSYERFRCSLTTFLEGIFDGSKLCRVFPASIFESDRSFQSV